MSSSDILSIPFRDLLAAMGLNQSECARRFSIPLRTVQGWALGERQCPGYVRLMMAELTVDKEAAMTDTQKREIITLYNKHRDDAETCLERMDQAGDDEKAAQTEKARKKANDRWWIAAGDHDAHMRAQEAISDTLAVLGYELVIDDEDYAVDVR